MNDIKVNITPQNNAFTLLNKFNSPNVLMVKLNKKELEESNKFPITYSNVVLVKLPKKILDDIDRAPIYLNSE